MKTKLSMLLIIFTLSGCATQTYLINGDSVTEPNEEKSEHFFVSGIGQKKTIDAAKVCGGVDKVVKVEAEQTFLNGFLGAITWGIYTPRTSRVYCKSH